MVIVKSLERIADHATNVAEEVVYLCEGRDIRHADKLPARDNKSSVRPNLNPMHTAKTPLVLSASPRPPAP
jgi:hypothetical protein